MRLPSTPTKRARIEVVPLIDIIFFLLATFVMVSLSMVQNQGIAVALPAATTGRPPPLDAPATATVTVTEAGRLYLNQEPVTVDELPERLEALRRQQPDVRVVFNGDEMAYFGDVVNALDRARTAGIEKVAIQTTGARVDAEPRSE